eukprot:8560332-Pyramimonas_sp.AAC.3
MPTLPCHRCCESRAGNRPGIPLLEEDRNTDQRQQPFRSSNTPLRRPTPLLVVQHPFLSCNTPSGCHFELSLAGDWWAAAPAEEWAALPEEARSRAARSFCAPSGDRRQELVFIGDATRMDQEAIR